MYDGEPVFGSWLRSRPRSKIGCVSHVERHSEEIALGIAHDPMLSSSCYGLSGGWRRFHYPLILFVFASLSVSL